MMKKPPRWAYNTVDELITDSGVALNENQYEATALAVSKLGALFEDTDFYKRLMKAGRASSEAASAAELAKAHAALKTLADNANADGRPEGLVYAQAAELFGKPIAAPDVPKDPEPRPEPAPEQTWWQRWWQAIVLTVMSAGAAALAWWNNVNPF